MNHMPDSITDGPQYEGDCLTCPTGLELFNDLLEKDQETLLADQMGEAYGNGKTFLGELNWLHSIGADLNDFLNEAKAAAVDNEYAAGKWMELYGWMEQA